MILIVFSIILVVSIGGCAETVPLEEYNAKVAEHESTISDLEADHAAALADKDTEIAALEADIVSLEAELAQAQTEYTVLDAELDTAEQDLVTASENIQSHILELETMKLYASIAYELWEGPPVGSTGVEIELFYGVLWESIDAAEDETLSELYFDFMLNTGRADLFNNLFRYIFSVLMGTG